MGISSHTVRALTARKLRLASGVGLMALWLGAPGAMAQATPTPDDQVVVVGIRKSLRAGIALKRSAANVTESITATDIGKLPDENVADSLQRVTGVQISRESGEGKGANIRGLAATTYINGRAAASPGNTRDFDMRNLTSDFFQSIEVSKSVVASQPEGTLGGTINLVTRKPLDFSKRTISISLEATYADYAKETKPRATFFIADKFAGGKFGASLGLSYSSRAIRQDVAFSQGGMRIGEAPADTGFDFNRDGIKRDYIRPNDYRFMSQLSERVRKGADMTLQWKPEENLDLRFDLTGARLTNELHSYFLGALNSFTPANTTNLVLDGDGFLKSATYANSPITVDGRYAPEIFDTLSAGFNGKWRHEKLTLTFDASSSLGSYRELAQIMRFGQATANATVNYSSNGDEAPANLDIRNANGTPYDLFAVALYRPNLTFNRTTKQRQLNNVVDIDGIYNLGAGWFQNVKFGTHLTDFNYRASEANLGNEFNNVNNAAFYNTDGTKKNATQSPIAQFVTTSFAPGGGIFSDLSGNFPRSWLNTLYPGGTIEDGSQTFVDQLNFAGKAPVSPLSVSHVNEKTKGLYATTDLEGTLFGLSAHANAGVRYVKTNLVSTGLDNNSTPISVESEYDNVLPAANLKLDVNDKLVLRLAGAKVMQRADLADLATSFNVNPGGGSATLGNPQLKPYEATQYDLAAEYYFSREGLISLTLFHKDVKNFTISTTTLADIPGYVPLNRPPGDPLGNKFFITQKQNGSGARIKGFELSYQQPFTFLPAAWQGFGTVLNYTYSDAETTTGAPYEGLARDTYNLIGYYEQGPVNVRLAYNYRSKVAQTIGANLNANSLGSGLAADGKPIGLYQYLAPQGFLDASVSYQVNQTVKLVLEGSNLTGTNNVLFVDKRSIVNEIYATDSRITVGVKLSY
jgi:iron complex outermembrane recepter protein